MYSRPMQVRRATLVLIPVVSITVAGKHHVYIAHYCLALFWDLRTERS